MWSYVVCSKSWLRCTKSRLCHTNRLEVANRWQRQRALTGKKTKEEQRNNKIQKMRVCFHTAKRLWPTQYNRAWSWSWWQVTQLKWHMFRMKAVENPLCVYPKLLHKFDVCWRQLGCWVWGPRWLDWLDFCWFLTLEVDFIWSFALKWHPFPRWTSIGRCCVVQQTAWCFHVSTATSLDNIVMDEQVQMGPVRGYTTLWTLWNQGFVNPVLFTLPMGFKASLGWWSHRKNVANLKLKLNDISRIWPLGIHSSAMANVWTALLF